MKAPECVQPAAPARAVARDDAARLAMLLRGMVAGARDAAAFIAAHAGGLATLVVERKAPADFVSEVDRGAESLLRGSLPRAAATAAFDDARFVGEEYTPDAATGGAGLVFVVDPLDGTTNFLHGYPWYAVSIGALVDGVLVAGVVLNAATGELFTATLGAGAQRNGVAIRVSGNADPSQALVGTGFPFRNLDRLDRYQRQFASVTRATAGIRRAGAAALDLCDVACGRFDAFWELQLAPWDVAAGLLIVREAGGLVTDLEGRDAAVATGPIVAGSRALHPWLLHTLADAAAQGAPR